MLSNINIRDTITPQLSIDSSKKSIYKNNSFMCLDDVYYLKVFGEEGPELSLQEMPEETNKMNSY